MEKNVLNLFDAHILRESARRFGANPALRLVSQVENFVYEGEDGQRPLILRVTHSSHRTAEAILGELDWIEYLYANGVSVPQAIGSVGGKLVEVVESDDSHFLVTAFQKLHGENIIKADACTPGMYQKWGRILGRMHALAKHYEPRHASYRREQWFQDDHVRHAAKYVAGQAIILEKHRRLMGHLHALPRDKDSFGLIHTDFTDVNFFVYDQEIAAFDFDDCQYHWFAYDIAVILFDIHWLPQREMGKEEFERFFWEHFWQGYTRENVLDGYWLDQLPLLMKLCEMCLYVFFYIKWDFDNLEEWQRDMIKKYQDNIEKDVLCLDVKAMLGAKT